MCARASHSRISVGVADHCGWAVLVAVDAGGAVVDRRRVELVEADLPKLPHHHECQALPIVEAVALVARVKRSAEACSASCLERLAASVPGPVTALSLRAFPPLPASVEERITNYQAQTRADGVMYREALARAAEARGWAVHWYEAASVTARAAAVLGRRSIEDFLAQPGTALGPPWQRDHRIAMAAAIAFGERRSKS